MNSDKIFAGSVRIAICLSTAIGLWQYGPQCCFSAAANKDRDTAKEKMQSKDFNAALDCLDRAIGADRTDPENFMLRGRCFFRMKNFELAIADFNMVLKLSPNYFSAFLWRGTAHAKLGADDLAIKDYEQSIRLNPRLAKRYFDAPGLKAKGQSQAVQAAERFRLPGVSPENLKSHAIAAYKEAMKRVYPDGLASGAAERSGNANPGTYATDADDATYLTDLAAGAGSDNATADGGNSSNQSANQSASKQASGAEQASSTKRKKHKGEELYQAVADRSEQSSATDDSGNLDIGRSDESLAASKNLRVTKRLDQDPDYGEFGTVAGTQPLNGDADLVIKRCTEAIRQDESNAEYFYMRAKAYQKISEPDKAYKDYCQAITVGTGPNLPKYYIGRASLFYQLNKPLLLDADLKQAQSLDQELPHVIHFGGQAYPKTVKWAGDGPG